MSRIRADFFSVLVFLYFLTLHADRLSIQMSGFTIRVNNLLALMLIALFLLRFRHHLFCFNKKMAYALLALACSLTLSALYSPYRQRCCFFLGWFILMILCYVMLPYFLVKMWDAKRIFSLYCASFIVVGTYACMQLILSLLGFHDPFADQYLFNAVVRPNAACYEPSYYALYMTPFIFMYNTYFLSSGESSFFIFRKKSPIQALFINFIYILSTSTAVFFAYLLFFSSAFFLSVISRKKLIRFIFSFCGGLIALLLTFPFSAKHFFLKFFFHGFLSHHSFFERWVGLVNGWKIFLRHPVLGVGLGGYPCYLMEAYLKEDSAFTFVKMHALIGEHYNPIKLFEAMNVTTELLASLGLLGLCAVLGGLFVVFVNIKKVNTEKVEVTALMISMIMAVMIIQFSQGLLRTYLWTHFILVFAYCEKKSETYETTAVNHNYS